MSILNVSNLSAGYGKKQILDDISFSVEEGKIVGILGSNGSGKTTLLKAICGQLSFTGSCKITDKNTNELSPKQLSLLCGYIPQKSGISIDLSALDVVMMGYNPQLKLLQPPTEQMRSSAISLLKKIGLENPFQGFQTLSEGQKQLCILARTFTGSKKLLLLDEPESALDFHMRYEAINQIREYINENSACALITLHDASLALNYCDELIVLSGSKLIGKISPAIDSLEIMEKLLSQVYGNISLMKIKDKAGKERLVMLRVD